MKQFLYIENPENKKVEELIIPINDITGIDFTGLNKELKKSGKNKWSIKKAFVSEPSSEEVSKARIQFGIETEESIK